MADKWSYESRAPHSGDMDAHVATYEGFLTGSIVLSLICAFVLVALCSFAFGQTWNVFLGFAGLIVGIVATAIDARMGSKRWFLALGALVVFGLITAVNVS